MGRIRSRLIGLLVFLFMAGAVQLLQWTGVDDPAEKALVAAIAATVIVVALTW